MPVQKGKSGLAAKLGQKLEKAHEAHKSDETEFGFGGGLPGGIDGGIAQLVECKFGQYEKGDNKGEYFFYAAGVVKSPKTLRDKEGSVIQIAGAHTKIGPEPICDTPDSTGKKKTLGDHWGWVLNELRKLGVDTKKFKAEHAEDVAAALKQAGPHFKFRTWQGKPTEQYPDPRVNEEWKGIAEYNAQEESAVQDDSGNNAADFKPGGETTSKKEEAPKKTKAAAGEGISPPTTATGTATPDESETDLDALAEVADNPDGGEEAADAARTIGGMCEEVGIDPGPMENWVAAVAALRANEESSETSPEETEEFEPDVRQVHLYKPAKAKKAIECEVTAVFKDKKTVNLKNLDDGKTLYKGVAWADLSQTG